MEVPRVGLKIGVFDYFFGNSPVPGAPNAISADLPRLTYVSPIRCTVSFPEVCKNYQLPLDPRGRRIPPPMSIASRYRQQFSILNARAGGGGQHRWGPDPERGKCPPGMGGGFGGWNRFFPHPRKGTSVGDVKPPEAPLWGARAKPRHLNCGCMLPFSASDAVQRCN